MKRQFIIVLLLLMVVLITGCDTSKESIHTPSLQTITLIDNEQVTILTNGWKTILQDYTNGTKTTFQKTIKPKQTRQKTISPELYTATPEYISNAASVFVHGSMIIILTDDKTFVI